MIQRSTPLKILIVEDDEVISLQILSACRKTGMECEPFIVSSGKDASDALDGGDIDLVLLDLVLPDTDGYRIAQVCLEQGVPFLIISSRTLPMDVVLGLEIGAEDYVKKPFDDRELSARIRKIAGRFFQAKPVQLKAGKLHFDLEKRRVTKDGVVLELTPTESKILFLLAENCDSHISTRKIIDSVWQDAPPADGFQSVRVHIRRLREKLEEDPALPRLILNKWGAGYMLRSGKEPHSHMQLMNNP